MKTRTGLAVSDSIADTYRQVRDLTINNSNLSVQEKLGILELVKTELMETALVDLRRSAMNA